MDLTALVGWTATALGISFAWPQALHALRSPSLLGISPTGQVLTLITSMSWVLYGVVIGDGIMIVANAAAGSAVGVTAGILLVRRHLAPATLAGALAGWAAAVVLAVVVVGDAAAGIVGGLLGIAMTVPQARALRRGVVPDGVSAATYALLAATMGCWLVYGVLERDLVIMFPNILGGPVVVLVLVLVLRAQRLPVLDLADA